MRLHQFKLILAILLATLMVSCGGKYLVKTYPSEAKVYTKAINSQEKKLIGTSPIEIPATSDLGDVFFLVIEKQNYKEKEVIVRVNNGESLTVAAQLDPMIGGQDDENQLAKNDKEDGNKKQGGSPPKKPDDKKMELLEEQVQEMNLRVALLENTTSFYKDAMFSPRFNGGMKSHERDESEDVVGFMFEAQQAVAQRQFNKALGLIDKAIRKNAYVSHAWVLKGSINYLQKNFEAAKTSWERALKLDPHNKVAYRYLSDVYQRLGAGRLPNKPAQLREPASLLEIEKRKIRQK